MECGVAVVSVHRTPSPQMCGVCNQAALKKLRCHDKDTSMPQYLYYQPTMWKLHFNRPWLTYPYTVKLWPVQNKRKKAATARDGERADGARPKLGSEMYRMLWHIRESGHWKLYGVGIILRMAPRTATPDTAPQRTPPLLAGPVHPWQLQGTTAASGRPAAPVA